MFRRNFSQILTRKMRVKSQKGLLPLISPSPLADAVQVVPCEREVRAKFVARLHAASPRAKMSLVIRQAAALVVAVNAFQLVCGSIVHRFGIPGTVLLNSCEFASKRLLFETGLKKTAQ